MSDLDQYQQDAVEFIAYDRSIAVDGIALYPVIALSEEVGEMSAKFSKAIRKDRSVDLEALKGELGDILWNVAALANEAGMSLSSIAHQNLHKLRSRQQRGAIRGDGDNR